MTQAVFADIFAAICLVAAIWAIRKYFLLKEDYDQKCMLLEASETYIHAIEDDRMRARKILGAREATLELPEESTEDAVIRALREVRNGDP